MLYRYNSAALTAIPGITATLLLLLSYYYYYYPAITLLLLLLPCPGRWSSITQGDAKRPRSSSRDLLVMGENPALEWNNYNPHQDKMGVPPVMQPLLVR